MKRFVFGSCLLVFFAFNSSSWAQEVDDFDNIVKSLSNSTRAKAPSTTRSTNPLDTSEIHAGIGIASNFSSMHTAAGHNIHSTQRGVQAALGIDLLSPDWLAEGTARSFTDQDVPDARVVLKEFDLKVLNKGAFMGMFTYRVGAGLSARYLTVNEHSTDSANPGELKSDYVTPASVFTGGIEARFNKMISFGSDVSYRTALITETIDQNSFDFVVRVDAHF